MKVPQIRKLLAPTLCGAALLAALSSQAASVFFDFNSDPTTSGLLTLYGNALWISYDGAGYATNVNDGYLSVTSAANSQRSAIVFSDFDGGQVVAGFTFDADVRIGNGTAQPADGFSVNYVRAGDPTLTATDPSADGGVWATGPNCEGNLPEEGTQTGISVGFDAWNSGGTPPYCNEADQSIGPDIIGVDVRVDGTLILQFPTPILNGNCTDPSSLQTGPQDGTGNPDILCWQHVKVNLTTNGLLNVYWKGVQILTNYATGYFPSPGRLVFAGRTGNANENHHIDNIAITTIPASVAEIGTLTQYPDGFKVTISDSGNSVVDNTTVTTTLNGGSVTPQVTKVGSTTTVLYHGFPNLIPPGSTNTVFISCQDTNHNTISGTRVFVENRYGNVPGADAVTGVDNTKPGFRMLPYQSPGEPNTVWWMDEQLAGLRGPNTADLSSATNNGYVNWNNVINFDITGPDGNFTTNNGYPDMPFPGIPGTAGTDNTAEEVMTFLYFAQPGIYTMGVNSDDGFDVTIGGNPKDRFAQDLGQFSGGRGASDTIFTFAVTNAGYYPVRMAWENGGGGANCEWFMIDTNNVKILINDPSVTNDLGVTAYWSGPALPAYVSQINPYAGATGCRPDTLLVQLTDGGSSSVVDASAHLSVNGSPVTTTVSRNGSVVTATGADATHLLPTGKVTATLTWNDTASVSHSNTWSFTVAPIVTLDPSISAPLNTADLSKPGFLLRVVQVDPCLPSVIDPTVPSDCGDGTENQVDSANAMIAGLYFPFFGTNAADVTTAVSGNRWYWSNAMDFNIVTSPGDFTLDNPLPGIPTIDGVASRPNDSFSAWFDGWVAFPNPGLYMLGVNSDDGFRLSQGWGATRMVLHVTGTNVNTDVAAVVTTYNNTGVPWSNSLPAVPISAQVVYVGTNDCPGPTTVNLTGKIALIDQDRCTPGNTGNYYNLVKMCQDQGAIACIVLAFPSWGTPERMTGSGTALLTIPALHVLGYNGGSDFWHTNGPLVATIGADTHPQLGIADYGKGMSHIDFPVNVTQAGLYPLHLTYMQGGGGAGMEFTSVGASGPAFGTGTRLLMNDNTSPSSLLSYRGLTTNPRFTSVSHANGQLTLTYTPGTTLQATTSLSPAAWTDVTPQYGDTYTAPMNSPYKFYRLRW